MPLLVPQDLLVKMQETLDEREIFHERMEVCSPVLRMWLGADEAKEVWHRCGFVMGHYSWHTQLARKGARTHDVRTHAHAGKGVAQVPARAATQLRIPRCCLSLPWSELKLIHLPRAGCTSLAWWTPSRGSCSTASRRCVRACDVCTCVRACVQACWRGGHGAAGAHAGCSTLHATHNAQMAHVVETEQRARAAR